VDQDRDDPVSCCNLSPSDQSGGKRPVEHGRHEEDRALWTRQRGETEEKRGEVLPAAARVAVQNVSRNAGEREHDRERHLHPGQTGPDEPRKRTHHDSGEQGHLGVSGYRPDECVHEKDGQAQEEHTEELACEYGFPGYQIPRGRQESPERRRRTGDRDPGVVREPVPQGEVPGKLRVDPAVVQRETVGARGALFLPEEVTHGHQHHDERYQYVCAGAQVRLTLLSPGGQGRSHRASNVEQIAPLRP